VSSTLRILHCLRSPAGGLFRRVRGLARGQADLGHKVGIVCDSGSGGPEATRLLDELRPHCELGVIRHPFPRRLGFGDFSAGWCVRQLVEDWRVEVLHGHGAKGGLYARLAGRSLLQQRNRPSIVYTPHGEISGRFAIAAERRLSPFTDGIVFESRFAAERYRELVSEPPCPTTIVPSGISPHEFYEAMIGEAAADFIYVGEPSYPKGLDVFLKALASQRRIFPATAVIVGTGPFERHFRRMSRWLGLGNKVAFSPPVAVRTALVRGRCVVVPARAETSPYMALEAAAARMPLIVTDVGGVAETFGGTSLPLVKAGDVAALAREMRVFLSTPKAFLDRAPRVQAHLQKRPPAETMAREVAAFYFSVLRKTPAPVELAGTTAKEE
jgi:glycosyltransferase involved in cell wall biosynthesis